MLVDVGDRHLGERRDALFVVDGKSSRCATNDRDVIDTVDDHVDRPRRAVPARAVYRDRNMSGNEPHGIVLHAVEEILHIRRAPRMRWVGQVTHDIVADTDRSAGIGAEGVEKAVVCHAVPDLVVREHIKLPDRAGNSRKDIGVECQVAHLHGHLGTAGSTQAVRDGIGEAVGPHKPDLRGVEDVPAAHGCDAVRRIDRHAGYAPCR